MAQVPALDLRNQTPDTAAPGSTEAEQAVLGAILYDNDALFGCEGLEPRHFREGVHGRMFEVCRAHIGKGILAEPIGIWEAMKDDPALIEFGGLSYLADLVDVAPPARTTRDFARIVIDASLRRDMIEVADEMKASAKQADVSPKETLEMAERALYEMGKGQAGAGGFVPFAEAIDEALEVAAQAYQRDGGLGGISTGLVDLDRRLGGLHASDLIILAGRPSMGKTALATNIAFHVAKSYQWEDQPDGTRKTVAGGQVGFFSLEMSKDQLASRILSEVAKVPSDKIRRGEITAMEFGLLREAGAEIRQVPLQIDATGGISLAKLCARARRMKRRGGLDLIVVDYLQLITLDDRRGGANRTQEVTEITQGLKALAKELGVPVIALSQLSRQVENREDKRPQLADLRESGSIEQDADVVMFVYREVYYLMRSEPRAGTPEHLAWLDAVNKVHGLAEAIIGKQRHGPIGSVRLHFNEDLTSFSNLAREGRDDVHMTYGGAGS
jgi:replicative DNA helicase